jgi:hypothetical protein
MGGYLPQRTIIHALVEQATSSLVNFAMMMTLLVLFRADVLGQFVFMFTLVMIITSLQYGLTLLPILVHVPVLDEAGRVEALDVIGGFDLVFRLCGIAAMVTGSWLATSDPWVLVAAGAFGGVFMWRETARATLFATGRSARAMAQALLGAALFAPLMLSLVQAGATVTAPLVAFAIGQGVAVAVLSPRLVQRLVTPLQAVRRHLSQFGGVRWSLTASAANEVHMRSHVFAVEALRGVDQVGVMEAGRVLWSPLVLAAAALQKVMQSALARAHAAGDAARARRMTFMACFVVAAGAAAYGGAIYLVFNVIAHHLYGDRYPDVAMFVVGWSFYSVLLVCNWLMSGYLNAAHAFQAVAQVNIAAAVATLLLLASLIWPVPLVATLGILILVQTGMALRLIWLITIAPPPVGPLAEAPADLPPRD